MIRAYLLYTSAEGHSHVQHGHVEEAALISTKSIHFKETPAHSSYDWHTAPDHQFVITLSGILEFTTTGGEKFVLQPGEVLVATDVTGSGHKWRLMNDEPWRRAYVVFEEGANVHFRPDA
jgi:hypothetical protein